MAFSASCFAKETYNIETPFLFYKMLSHLCTMNRQLVLCLLFLISFRVNSQQNILDNAEVQHNVERCLYNTYSYNFIEAKHYQEILEKQLALHPAPYFLRALILYWEYFPLLPGEPEVKEYEFYINLAVEKSKIMLEKDSNSMEAIFFDMHARAFRAMFWADNGKPGKAIADIDNMYRSTLKGIDFKEKFNEFYFSSGLYNYYIEAYVEIHPLYKPLALLFQRGNKELGLRELQYAIDSTTYITYEAQLYMSLIQLNYEQNLGTALEYAANLYNHFPRNIYYLGQYLIILVHNRQFTVASVLNEKLGCEKEPFHHLIYQLIEGFLYENHRNSVDEAKLAYQRVISEAENFGPVADLYVAIAYAGLARIAEKDNNSWDARKFRKKSSQLSGYKFILDF